MPAMYCDADADADWLDRLETFSVEAIRPSLLEEHDVVCMGKRKMKTLVPMHMPSLKELGEDFRAYTDAEIQQHMPQPLFLFPTSPPLTRP